MESHKFVISLQKTHSYSLSQIGNADQTPVYVEMPFDRTINNKGNKITVRTGGNEHHKVHSYAMHYG